jgi:hypothetical protein
LRNKSDAFVKTRVNDSSCWKAILKVEKIVEGNLFTHGDLVQFSHDIWPNFTPLSVSNYLLIDICQA